MQECNCNFNTFKNTHRDERRWYSRSFILILIRTRRQFKLPGSRQFNPVSTIPFPVSLEAKYVIHVYKRTLFDLPFYTIYISTQDIFGYEFQAGKRTSFDPRASLHEITHRTTRNVSFVLASSWQSSEEGKKRKTGGRRHARIIKKVCTFWNQ